MEGDSKGAVKRSNPSSGGDSNPSKMMKTGTTGSTHSNTGGYGTGQTSGTTVTTTRKPQKATNVKPDTSNPVIAHVQNILSSMVGTGLNPHTTKDAVSKLKEVLGPTPSNYYEQKVPKGKQLCRHYSKGYCQRGNTCSFLHSDLGPDVNEQVFSGLQEIGAVHSQQGYMGQQQYPGYGGGQYMQQQQGGYNYNYQGQGPNFQGHWYPNQGQMWGPQNTMNQWGNNQAASGNNTHNQSGGESQGREIGPQQYPNNSGNLMGSKDKKGNVCRHFAAGHCRRGDTCAFLHPEGDGPDD